MKRSYMVAVQVTVKPVVYIEVIANSASEAVLNVNQDVMQTIANNLEAFHDETKLEFQDISEKQVKTISCGRSSQYHTESECEVCASLGESK